MKDIVAFDRDTTDNSVRALNTRGNEFSIAFKFYSDDISPSQYHCFPMFKLTVESDLLSPPELFRVHPRQFSWGKFHV